MLQVPTEFPHVGSYAVFRGTKVRIQGIHPNGTRLVMGRTDRNRQVTATVALAQLAPWSEPEDALELWAERRIASVNPPSFTPTAEAFVDYTAWHRQTYQRDPAMTAKAFVRAMEAKGFPRGRQLYSNTRGFTIALHEKAIAA